MTKLRSVRELKRERKSLGINQADLAFSVNISRPRFSKIETKSVRATNSELAKIGYALGFEVGNKCLICEKNINGVGYCEAYEDKSDPITRDGKCIGLKVDITPIFDWGGE